MPGPLSDVWKWIKAAFGTKAAAYLATAAFGALPLVPAIWKHWYLAVDPELARLASFALFLLLGCLVLLVPRRGLPIKVNPVRERGPEALLSVRNCGRDADFYGTVEILDAKEPGVSGGSNFRRLSLQPSWVVPSGRHRTSMGLKRDQIGNLRLAIHRDTADTDNRQRPMLMVQFEDAQGQEQRFWWERGPQGGFQAKVRVTIARVERDASPLFLRPPKSYSAEFLITGHSLGGLSADFSV